MEKSINKYPTAKVILGYTLLGGLAGSVILIIIAQVAALFKDDSLLSLGEIKSFIILVGVMMGTIPALITGTLLALTKTYLNKIKDGIKCLVVGFLVTAVLSMAGFFLDSSVLWEFLWDSVMDIGVLSGVGGLSSLILAVLLLPKRLEKKGE